MSEEHPKTLMPGLEFFPALIDRLGLPAAGLLLASLTAFAIAVKDGFHFANFTLMVSATLFCSSCAFKAWHSRQRASVSYHGEKESRWQRLESSSLPAFGKVLFFVVLAVVFTYFAYKAI